MLTGVDHARLRTPRPRHDLIKRPRLEETLDRLMSYPVVLVEADAGYGKTTAALSLARRRAHAWCALTTADKDPAVFVTHLLTALDQACPGLAEEVVNRTASEIAAGVWTAVVDHVAQALEDGLESDTYLVLDDLHLVDEPAVSAVVERLVDRLPVRLHLVVTSRRRPRLPSLLRWRAGGDLATVARVDLAFNSEEVIEFCRLRFGLALTKGQAEVMAEETEGWPIAVQLVAQHLRESGIEVETLVSRLPEGRQEIFGYLSDQVLNRLPRRLRRFLVASAHLRLLDAAACAAVTEDGDAVEMLDAVAASGLFCSPDGDGRYRLHHLFRDFLRSQAADEVRLRCHHRAAGHFRQRGDLEEAVYHELEAGDVAAAATDLSALGPSMLRAGRYVTLLDWSERIPLDVRRRFPALHVQRSSALRLTSVFGEAVAEARRGAALADDRNDSFGVFEAQAAEVLVYLDTVQPSRAVPLLVAMGRGLRRLGVEERRLWWSLVAENRLNEGRLELASAGYRRAARSGADVAASPVRLLVRRGELQHALLALETGSVDSGRRAPRSHRERDALLAWTHALLGSSADALRHATRGIAIADQLCSPIVACVCKSRVGHAYLTGESADPVRAKEVYTEALRSAELINVPRFRAESLIGLVVVAGRLGDSGGVWRHGFAALEVLESAGDRYLTALTKLAIGGAAAQLGHPDADSWLAAADDQATRCGDMYVPTLARLWRGWLALERNDAEQFADHAAAALSVIRERGLEDVLVRSPWLGIGGYTTRSAWLRAASQVPGWQDYASYLATRLRREDVAVQGQPGVDAVASIRVRCLGSFEVDRDGELIEENAWGRRKARELLGLLCARDDHSITREEAVAALWPDAQLEPGAVRFRVALHALNDALEPDRPARTPTRFVHATTGRVVLDHRVQVDVDDFQQLSRLVRKEPDPARARELGLRAVELYRGPFLADTPYLEWAGSVRAELAEAFADLTIRVAELELESSDGNLGRAAQLARRILEHDPYRESAYRLVARALLAQGDTAAAQQVWKTCRACLTSELDVEPTWSVEDLQTL
jgi:DNA-binding SARP family transcriptional activator